MLKRLPSFTRNFFFLTSIFFIVWMSFFDSNDLFTQFTRTNKIKGLEAQREYYLEKIDEVKEDREELLSNPELLEKFAREKYLMKKPTEDIYVIVEKE